MSSTRLFLTAVLLIVLVATSVEAQGPPGGAMGFISRLDANKNGQLDPDEQGRARPFLERIARETGGLDLNRPIPLQSLASKVQQMQGGGGGDQSRDRSRSRGGSQPRNSGDRRYDDDAASAAEGLVPGFNELPEDLVPPVGFGSKAEYLNVDVIQADFDEAENTIKRYDRNRDGILDQEEIRNARWLYGNPMNQDRNGDGRLTKSELAVRYSIRRDTQKDQEREKAFRDSQNPQSNNQQSRDSGQSRSRDGRSRGGGDSGSSDRMAQFAESIFQRYDSNKSGVFEKDEWKNFRTDPTAYDVNKDGKITRDELIKGMSQRFGGGRSSGGDNGSQSGRTTWNGGDKGPAGGGSGESPKSYRFKTAHERLPEGIPQWFREGDRNRDGQIAMSEYSGQWNEKTLSEYYVYDKNRDGLLTVEEVMAAKQTGFVRGVSAPPRNSSADSGKPTGDSAKPTTDQPASGADPRYVKYAVTLIGRYDKNKDGILDLGEIKDTKSVKPEFDQNKDGKLTPTEIAIGLGKK